MVTKPRFSFPSVPELYAQNPVPRLSEWQSLWEVWDVVTQGMISDSALYTKPINLRNECIFYLGHIPTFLDIKLTSVTCEPAAEPAYYRQIFERGIDPDVESLEVAHSHSKRPDHWPPADEIKAFQDRIRRRVSKLYESNTASKDRRVGRALWLGFEHEAMHLETLLYMLLQSDLTLLPPGTILPDFEALADKARWASVPNQWFDIPETEVKIGLDDLENDVGPDRYFAWDAEKPSRKVHVKSFQAKGRPITNREYAEYLQKTGNSTFPASWIETTQMTRFANGHPGNVGIQNSSDFNAQGKASDAKFFRGKAVRTVFGAVPLEYALDWPVFASFNELDGCARWMGGRIPKLEEAQSIYAHAAALREKDVQQAHANTIPAVNSHLVNDGVQETPPSNDAQAGLASTSSQLASRDCFVDLLGANVGFKYWHPVPISQDGNRLAGQGEMGGVWEWTSSVLEAHDGFEQMPLYPGFSADFFDSKHNIALGGSWSTHPRLAGRKSFINWYQRNYPYAWAGARVVRDV